MRRLKRLIAFAMVAGMFLGQLNGVQFVSAEETSVQNEISENTKEFTEYDYSIKVKKQAAWDKGYVVEATIKNTGDKQIRNWDIEVGFAKGCIDNIWNADYDVDKTNTVIHCKVHNQILKPGESITFGFQVKEGKFDDLQRMKLLQKAEMINSKEDYSVSYRITSQWSNHAIIEAEVINNTKKDILDWKINFDFAAEISNIWNAEITEHNDVNYRLKNKDYNACIKAGERVTFGFEAVYPDEVITCPCNSTLQSTSSEKEKTAEPTAESTPVSTPMATPIESEEPQVETGDEDFDPEKDAYVYHDIENPDWNMEMINADSEIVKEQKDNPKGPIRVALLDSGVNYSEDVFVHARKNFVPGQDDYSALFEDVSGHGTAIAEVMASDPQATPVADYEFEDEDAGKYEYYGEDGNAKDKIEPAVVEYEDWEKEQSEKDDANCLSLLDLLESGYERIEGINPNMDLISAKVLDENNETTVARVVEAIDWAIENDSDIISMSFGMEEDSEVLHKAVKKASKAGILLIASAGNKGKVEYPAAYPEVMAVGSVDSVAQQAQESAVGTELEVVAPGEFIMSRGCFDSTQIFSGSSMAVPHVTGLASLLWQKDITKSAQFIRQLIDTSARGCGDTSKYGYGVIDCEYALQQYDSFAKVYDLNDIDDTPNDASIAEEVEKSFDNTGVIETDQDIRKLYGSWGEDTHIAFVTQNINEKKWISGKCIIECLQKGTTFVDNKKKNPKCQGMDNHPWFHGYTGKKALKSNYLASYTYLVQLAQKMYTEGSTNLVNTTSAVFNRNTELANAYKGINEAFADEDMIGSQTWDNISKYCKKQGGKIPKKYRSLVIYGMALHTATDIYAHSSYCCIDQTESKKIIWERLKHDKKVQEKSVLKKSKLKKNKIIDVYKADATTICEKRYKNAKQIANNILKNISYKVISSEQKFCGYKSAASSLNNLCGTQYYNINNYIVKNGGTNIINQKYLNNAYALADLYKYVIQVEKKNNKNYIKLKDKASALDLNKIKSITNNYLILQGKVREFWKFDNFTVTDSITKNKVCSISKDKNDKFAIVVAKDSKCTVMAKSNSRCGRKLCCKVANGTVQSYAGYQLKNSSVSQMEDNETEDSALICDTYDFTFPVCNTFRIELSWKGENIDLDSILGVITPENESFYLTCFYEKTEHPELGEVFQCDDCRTEIEQDVQTGGVERTIIYNLEPNGLYDFSVRNYKEDDEAEDLYYSEAKVSVYQGDDVIPFYTATVPKKKGYYWNVFRLDVRTMQLIPINVISLRYWK